VAAVSFELLVNGAPASSGLLDALQQIEVEDHAEMADMLRLRLATGVREDGSGWTILDDQVFQRLTNIRVMVTAGSSVEPLIDAYVIETHVEFSNGPGASVLEVVAMDPTVLMNLEEKVRPWPSMADSDIATLIFQENGLEPHVQQTQPARPEVDVTNIQRGTDMQFLRKLAERNGYEIYAEFNAAGNTIEGYFQSPRPDQKPQGVLNVNLGEGTNVNTFKARFDMLRPATAKAMGLDIETQSTQPAQVEKVGLSEQGSSSVHNGDRPRVVLLSQTGLTQTGELQTMAQAVVDRSGWAITAEGDLHTVAYGGVLRAKRSVEVRGAGRLFSGIYYVEKVLHTLTGDSYTQRFSLRRNALGLTGQERFVEDPALP
jgi:phage protein D